MSVSENPVHIHEYTAEELQGLLSRVFSRVTFASWTPRVSPTNVRAGCSRRYTCRPWRWRQWPAWRA